METDDVDEEEFGFSRNYFLSKELGGSGKKSTHKISDIVPVEEQELRAAAANIEPKHEKEIISLMSSYKSLYSKWVFELRCGFGLLMYGFGSKKALIEDFASMALTDYSVVVINGYLPSISLKQVVIVLAELWWDQLKTKRRTSAKTSLKIQQPFSSQSMDDLLQFLDGSETEENNSFMCVLVHNIDGPGLRDADSQQHLARLASCSHIRVVASIDNVNAPLRMPADNLYTVARERFLVSSQVTLNSHLTEFKDHELLKTRKRSDGQDCLHIPLPADALEKLLSVICQ
ncbi:hypothetical protein Tsubulata_026350 [Turnera subulata]|uniref:Origin recognition complex subunit 2 n=1 Tax=Turnera subulata TaxID=218843 RepID=A0A9Q0J7Z6_9ROSI|nr:hypothetical protein Tsubulata_026350 [Turnera subulata]